MKKFFFIAVAAMAIISANAESSFTFGNGNEYRVSPAKLGSILDVPMSCHIDYRADYFYIEYSYPQGFMPHDLYDTRCMDALEDLTVDYTYYTGETRSYTPYLSIGEGGCSASAYLTPTGYYDYNEDGVFEPYGSVKWEPGDYTMFMVHFWVDDTFRKGDVILDGNFGAGYDRRGGTVGECLQFFKRVHVWVGYMLGDCDGNERVNISDVTTLINYLLTHDGLDEFELVAADFNQDGQISIADVTALTNYLLTH